MSGRGGNDNYVVNEVGDVVDESLPGSGGTDDVLSFVSFSLAGPKALGSVENLHLALGTAALNAAGNGLANTLVGNDDDQVGESRDHRDRADHTAHRHPDPHAWCVRR